MKQVKSIKVFNHPNDGLETSFLQKEELYNEQGQIIEESSFFANGEIENKNIFVFDTEGNLIEQKNIIENNELTEHTKIKRDTEGKIIEEKTLFLDGSETIKEYHREGDLVIIKSIDSEEGLESIEKILIDKRNRIIVKEVFDENNTLTEKIENTFDGDHLISSVQFSPENDTQIEKLEYQNDNLIKRSIYTIDNKLIQSVQFSYDDKNRLIKYLYSNGYRFENEYDEENNKKIEKQLQANGIIEYQKEIFYDNEERVIKESDFGQTLLYEYTFFD